MENDKKALIFNGFGLLASIVILLSGQLFSQTLIYLLIQIFGVLLISWALLTIKVQKKTSAKLPKGYFYIQNGPYEIVRHPVYAGFVLIMLSFVEIEFTFLRLLALLFLCIAIMLKILREEDFMLQEFHGYKEYKRKTKALIPYLL